MKRIKFPYCVSYDTINIVYGYEDSEREIVEENGEFQILDNFQSDDEEEYLL